MQPGVGREEQGGQWAEVIAEAQIWKNQDEFGPWAGRGNLEVDPVAESMKCQQGRPRAWDLTLRARGSRRGQTGRESVTCLSDLAPPGGLGRLHLLWGSGSGTTEHPDFKAPQKSPNFNLLFQRAGNR